MKKINILFALAMAFLLGSCAIDPNDQIKGIWELTDVKFGFSDGKEMTDDQKSLSDTLAKEILSENISIEFKEDEVYAKTSKGVTETGIYSAIEIEDKIEILLASDEVNKEATKMTLSNLTDSKMTAKYDVEEGLYIEYIYTKK